MNTIKWLAGFLRIRKTRVVSAAGFLSRLYAGAKSGRLWSSWISSGLSANEEVKHSLRMLRDRSRQLERDDGYVKRYLNLCETHVVGAEGMKLENRARMRDDSRRLDEEANNAIEEAWAAWCRPGVCTGDGTTSFRDIERLHIRCVLRDGDFVARFIRGAANREKLQLQVLDAEQLDDQYDTDLGGGSVVRMGVEISPLGNPVAYHILPYHPGDSRLAHSYNSRKRLLADEILHSFMRTRPGQVRGVPEYHTAMTTLHQAGSYIEAAIINARVGATNMGFFTTDSGDELPGEKKEGQKRITDAAPGTFEELPKGWSLEKWDPKYPDEQFPHFIRAINEKASVDFDLSYATCTGDLSKVSFSSIRKGTQQDEEKWTMFQAFAMWSFNYRVFSKWLLHALMTELLPYGVAEFERLCRPEWLPRKWGYVNPIQDVQAQVVAIENNLTTLTWELAKRGKTLEDLIKTRQREKLLLEQAGIPMLGLYSELLEESTKETTETSSGIPGE